MIPNPSTPMVIDEDDKLEPFESTLVIEELLQRRLMQRATFSWRFGRSW
jgi:hypothetical protein